MQRRAESVEPCERKFPIDDRFVRKTSAGAPIFLRHRRAKQSGLACFGPYVAIVDVSLVPAIEMGHKFVGDEAPRLLLEQDKVFAHPGRAREIECVHGKSNPQAKIGPGPGGREQ